MVSSNESQDNIDQKYKIYKSFKYAPVLRKLFIEGNVQRREY